MKRWKVIGVCCAAAFALAVAGWLVLRDGDLYEREFLTAVTALEQGDIDRVREAVENLGKSPQYAPHVHFLNGALLLRGGDVLGSLREFDLAAFHPELEVRVLVLSGQALYQANRAREAEQRWLKAIELAPDNAAAHRWLGVYYYDLGAMEDAVRHLERVAELAPDDARVHRLMALIHKDFGHFAQAAEHYEKSLQRDPHPQDLSAILTELAESRMELREYEKALASLERAAPDPKILVLQAECYLNLGQAKLALARVDEALGVAPQDRSALLTKGKILLESSDAATAVKVLSEACLLHRKDYFVHFTLAQAQRLAGDAEGAEKTSALAENLRSEWHEYSELNRKAIEDTANVGLRHELGLFALRLDRPDLAIGWFRAALALDPTHSASRSELAKLTPD